MDIQVGDRIQIVDGAIDVTSGKHVKAGVMYGEGGPLWAIVDFVDPEWKTNGKYGLPPTIPKVRCVTEDGIVAWQISAEDCCNVIKSSEPYSSNTEQLPGPVPRDPSTEEDTVMEETQAEEKITPTVKEVPITYTAYAIKRGSNSWTGPGSVPSTPVDDSELPPTADIITSGAGSTAMLKNSDYIGIPNRGTWRELNERERKSIGSPNIEIDENVIHPAPFKTAWQDPDKRRQMLNEDIENIQNSAGFPFLKSGASDMIAAKYDYKIIPRDEYKAIVNLDDKLRDVRASMGIQVHGSNQIGRAVKYYMYNRFKVPDLNLAHNKSVTHVFFTRPDLNILTCGSNPTANSQVLNHTESAMVWRRYPEIFKLLTDSTRCGDGNNFNMLLSNQVTSFDIQDEILTTNPVGKSWGGYTIEYGDSYDGRSAGEFSCNFTEVCDYSVINMIKLWITYIDNVSRGAWSPSYNLRGSGGVSHSGTGASHVYTRTIDYAASAYVFKCGPDGEDVLYWTKYYGVFPINTGASALSWDSSKSIGDSPNMSIRFRYSYKRDLSPVSLIEFNHNACIGSKSDAKYVPSYNLNYAHSSRPFVGTPYVEIDLASPSMRGGGVNYAQKLSHIRLKFTERSDAELTDDLLFKKAI